MPIIGERLLPELLDIERVAIALGFIKLTGQGRYELPWGDRDIARVGAQTERASVSFVRGQDHVDILAQAVPDLAPCASAATGHDPHSLAQVRHIVVPISLTGSSRAA